MERDRLCPQGTGLVQVHLETSFEAHGPRAHGTSIVRTRQEASLPRCPNSLWNLTESSSVSQRGRFSALGGGDPSALHSQVPSCPCSLTCGLGPAGERCQPGGKEGSPRALSGPQATCGLTAHPGLLWTETPVPSTQGLAVRGLLCGTVPFEEVKAGRAETDPLA